jgi:hypothetical protein
VSALLRRFVVPRFRVWKQAVWRPSAWVVAALYAALQLYQAFKGEWLSSESQESLRLPKILPTLPWWGWLIGWLLLFIAIILEGAYRTTRERDRTISERDRMVAALTASGPRLEVVFDPKCEGCYDESGTQVCLGVWNSGETADDVHVYLASVEPGPRVGKLELSWFGEGPHGRRINPTVPGGHNHFHFLVGGSSGPYEFAAQSPGGALLPLEGSHGYVAEVLVEGRNVRPPIVAKVEIAGRGDPPVRSVAPASWGL